MAHKILTVATKRQTDDWRKSLIEKVAKYARGGERVIARDKHKRSIPSTPARSKARMVQQVCWSPEPGITIVQGAFFVESLNEYLSWSNAIVDGKLIPSRGGKKKQTGYRSDFRRGVIRVLNEELPEMTENKRLRAAIEHVVFTRIGPGTLQRDNLEGGWKWGVDAFFMWRATGVMVGPKRLLYIDGKPVTAEELKTIGDHDDVIWEPWNPKGTVTCAKDQITFPGEDRGLSGFQIELHTHESVSQRKR